MEGKELLQGLSLMVIGMAVVLVALLLLLGLIDLLGLANRLWERMTQPAAPVGEEVSDEEVAVITAAITVALAARVDIHKIHLIREEAYQDWSRLGRLDIMGSHVPGGGKK